MDILNNQQIPITKDIMSDIASVSNTSAAHSSSGISFENYLKAVNDNIEQQERRERNDYSDRKEYQKDPYIERRDPYAKDRYNENTSRNNSFASADNYNKPTNRSAFDINDRHDRNKQPSSTTTAESNRKARNNYDSSDERLSTQEYNNVDKNPIHIGNIYQNRVKDKSLGELNSAGLSNDRSSTENLSVASLAYKIHSLLNAKNPGDESLTDGSSLEEMSMKDLLAIINGMSKDELDALNKLVDTDTVGISDLELSNLDEIKELIVPAQQSGINSGVKAATDSEMNTVTAVVSDKSGLLNEQDIINFYESGNKAEKTSSDTVLVESLKANKDMLLTEGNIVSADVILGGSKNKNINSVDTSMLDLIKQVSSKDSDDESLLDLIKKIAGDIESKGLDDSNENLAQADVKSIQSDDISEEVITEEVVSNDVNLKSSKTLSFDDLVNAINSDMSKNIPETTQEVLVESESTNIKSENIQLTDSSVIEEQSTTPLTKNEVVSTLEDALNRLTNSNIVEEDRTASTNDESVEEVAPKVKLASTEVNSSDAKSKIDKAFVITEEENKVIDAMKKSLFTENSKADKNKLEDTQDINILNKASADGLLSELNKDALSVASSQSKDFKDAFAQDLLEESSESDVELDLELANKDLSQEEDDTSNDPSGKGNKSLEDVEETHSSDSLTIEESVVADSSDNENPSLKLNEQATKNIDKVDLSKQGQSNTGSGSNSTKNDNLVNSFNNQSMEKTAENRKDVSQPRGNPVPVYDLKNSSDIGKLVKSIDQSVLKGESKLTVNLFPAHLGKLEIQLAEVAGKMTAKFITESESSHKIMLSQTEALRNHLSEKGIVVDSMEFKFDDSSRQQQQQQQQQQAENERRSAARNGMNKKNENRDNSLERDNNINFRAKAKPGVYA